MTELAPNPTPQPALTPTTSDAPSGGAPAPAFYESFQDQGLKTNPRLQRLGSVEDMARSLINAESRLGVPEDQIMRLPSDPKDDKALREIYTKLGLPEKIEGYNIKLDDKATDADKSMLSDMLSTAHKLGVPQTMAQGLVAWWQQKGAEFQQQQGQQAEQARTAAENGLKTEWGAKYDTYTKEIGRLLRDTGAPDVAGELDGGKLGNHPQLARALAKIVDRLAEPGTPGGRSGDPVTSLTGSMTPAQATAALATLNGDAVKSKALMDAGHPQHKAVLAERNRLARIRDGKEES